MLKGKTVILGVTGGIAAYKSAWLTSLLVKAGADVQVIMTEHAREFIAPLTFEALTNQRCHTDTFDRNHEYSTEHVSLASRADAVIIARPFVTAVYGGGAEGVAAYVEKIGGELADAMSMCGASSLRDISRDMVR